MSAPGPPGPGNIQGPATTNPAGPRRPTEALLTQSTTDVLAGGDPNAPGKKRRNHRGGRRKKNRRQSFLPGNQEGNTDPARSSHDLNEPSTSSAARPPFYRLGQSGGGNLSETSLDSNALLDHRWDHRAYLSFECWD